MAICRATSWVGSWWISRPFRYTAPAWGGRMRLMPLSNVDLPEPLAPHQAQPFLLLDAEVDGFHNGLLAVSSRKVLNRKHHGYNLPIADERRYSKRMNTGAPSRAVTMPTGNSTGPDRATKSAAASTSAPPQGRKGQHQSVVGAHQQPHPRGARSGQQSPPVRRC